MMGQLKFMKHMIWFAHKKDVDTLCKWGQAENGKWPVWFIHLHHGVKRVPLPWDQQFWNSYITFKTCIFWSLTISPKANVWWRMLVLCETPYRPYVSHTCVRANFLWGKGGGTIFCQYFVFNSLLVVRFLSAIYGSYFRVPRDSNLKMARIAFGAKLPSSSFAGSMKA